ncbi:hypothetical protein FRC12_018355 [Ceratobasidium sp. 428]|nr:hypothetical protein FRC12_018355 [Ceratobasidium sp. 428]
MKLFAEVACSQYGQLQHIFALPLCPNTPANPSANKKTLLLALIAEAMVTVEKTYNYTVAYYEEALKSGEVVDAQSIQCLVGRFWDQNRFWIVNRSENGEFTFPNSFNRMIILSNLTLM